MDVKRRKTLVGEKGGRYCVHLLTWDKRRERALEGETRTLVVLSSRYMDEQKRCKSGRHMDEQKKGKSSRYMDEQKMCKSDRYMDEQRKV
jgi:hypothetical protein